MKISPRGIEAIKKHEGLRLKAYDDGTGVQTVGYGHTGGVQPGQEISAELAEEFLRADIAECERAIARHVVVPLTQSQFDALCSFIFNVGSGAFAGSTLARKLNAGDIDGAAQEFVRWNHAGGRVLDGLTKRRLAEREMFLSDSQAITSETGSQPVLEHGHSEQPRTTMPTFAEVVRNPATAGLLSLVNPLLGLVPQIASIFMDKESGRTVPERNVAVAVKIAEVAQKALADAGKPAANMQEVVQSIATDPEAKSIARSAILDQCLHLVESGGGGIEGARKFLVDSAGSLGDATMKIVKGVTYAALSFLVLANIGSYAAWITLMVLGKDQHVATALQLVTQVNQADIGAAMVAFGFWLGSSWGSKQKTAQAAQ